MIDLSFLTEAEQEAILKVLNRDAELKKAEEERVKHLQDVVDDESEYKYKSGQWFYEAKSRRHRDKIHGAELVRASIRKRKKPTTLAELSELSKDSSKRRWVNSVNQDIFIPPELYGVMEAPDEAEEDVMVKIQEGNQSSKKVSFSSPEKEQDKLRNGTLSPPKPTRLNPFDADGLLDESEYNNEEPNSNPENLMNGTGKPKSDIMSSLAKYGVKLPYPPPSKGTLNAPRAHDEEENSQKQDVQVPVPKPRKNLKMNDQPQDQSNSTLKRDDSFNGTGRPRGILKRRSSSSSTDSESIRISQSVEPSKTVLPGSPIFEAVQQNYFDEPDATSDNSPDRQKQVRFSEKIQQRPLSPNLDLFSGREVGEYGILDPSLSVKAVDNGFVDLNESEDSILDQDSYPTDSLTKEQNAKLENQGISLEFERMEMTPKEDLSKKNTLREASSDISIKPPSNNSSGEEPLYSVVKSPAASAPSQEKGEEPLYSVVKSPAASAPSQEKDFDLDDALMEPRFHGQRGKTQNIYLNEKPLEFGKSYSGEGKITYESDYPSKKHTESYRFSSEELMPERSMITETSHRTMDDKPVAITQDDEPAESVAFWRRHLIFENQEPRQSSVDLPEEQKISTHILQDSPGVDKAEYTFGKSYPENLTSPKAALGEDRKETKYKSMLQNRFDAEHKPVELTSNMPVVQNMSESSQTYGQLDKSFENKGRTDLPKSAHFKVMSMKERMNEMPREQMSNPSQFQSLKHFWNVEEKNLQRETVVTSPDKILTHVSSRNKPTRTDLKQRSSEMPADEVMLPSTSDSLSEEEQTSQKVATWLAQTPTVYGVGHMDPDEEKSYSGEEIVEHVQKSTLPKKSDDELANALQKLGEETLEVPKKTEIERSRTEEIKMMPQVNPYSMGRKQTTIAVSPISQKFIETKVPALDPKTSDSGFYKRVLQISNAESPVKETVRVEPQSKPLVENKAKTVAPEKSASEFGIRFGKFNNGTSDKEAQKDSSLPNEESVAEEKIEKSAVPESQDQQDFISALKRLEIEACKPPPLPDVEAEYQDKLLEEEIRQNAASPVKSSSMNVVNFGSASETNDLDMSTERSVKFQMQHSSAPNKEPAIDYSSDLEETIEKSTVPSRKENEDLSIALKKLELEASEHQSDEKYDGINQKVEFEKPERQVALQTNLRQSHSDLNCSSSSDNGDDLEQPPKVSYGLKYDPNAFDGQGELPVAEEPSIESTRVESQENAADFHNRLLQLEEQAKIPEEPEDLLAQETVKVSQFPNREVFISKKVYSSMESMHSSVDSESGKAKEKEVDPLSKPKDFSDLPSYHYSLNEELANPLSPKSSGSYPENGNILYKKPEVGSPEVSNSKPGIDASHPILSALKRSEAKTLNYKAVQEVSPTSTNPLNSSSPTEDTPAPTVNSFPQNAETLKRLSQSVPAFIQDETDGRDTDSASESSFQIGRHKKSPSSLTNLSGSSGMASMSSVSGSVMSIYSGDFGSLDIKGGIEFSIEYVEALKEFLIYIYQCRDLAVAEVKKQRSDPYVKAYLLPEKAKMGKRKTAVKKKTLNPVYNEILRYKIPKQSLVAQTLNLSVWHHDALGRNSFLGEVNVNLRTWDLSNTQRRWYQLEPRTPAAGMGLENRGEMKLAIKYVPESPTATKPSVTGEVYIWIKDCLQLPMLRDNKINSFVKCTVLPDTSRKSRQKTRTVDKTPSPIFNHTMVYDGFKEEDLREACVELTVWDHNRLSNHFLGGLRIGLGTGKSYGTAVDWMDSTHEESVMWEKMMASPNTWVDGMLPLRMFKMAKLTK